MTIYYTTTGVWVVFLLITTSLFYRFRQHPAIQHRDVPLTMVSIVANAIFSVHYLVKIPLEGRYPCALYLWVPIIFMPLWLMTLLARLTRIIAAYRLGEARLRAVELTQAAKASANNNNNNISDGASPSASLTEPRRASLRRTVKKLLRSSSAHEPMIERMTSVVKKKASYSAAHAGPSDENVSAEERDPWPAHEPPAHDTATATSVVVDPDRAYATLTSPRSAHWTFVYRQHLTTPSLVRMIVVLEAIILIGAVFFHYLFREALLHRPDGTCGSSPAFVYIWVVAGLYLVVVTPVLLYAARDVRDAWGIRNELVFCDVIGIISCILYGVFRINDWDDRSVWPATLWTLMGTAFTHTWTVARPAIRAACDLRDIRHQKHEPVMVSRPINEAILSDVPRIRRIPSAISCQSLSQSPPSPPPPHTDPACPPPPSPTSISRLNVYRDRITSWQHTPATRETANSTVTPITLDTILACPNLLSKFRSFCMYDLSLEALLFYETVIHITSTTTRIIISARHPRMTTMPRGNRT
ncbi:hypothetical protein SYNPS1DRAFT_24991 [Syncephalis pseudoplumigaleata]|uniref:RGS domain-containing protein n=1 Tax=Syncephalis pseudoplumigaleata TaxID=1712513 RepID=A0A4P9YTE4_9FUNG|nr:hypothetical protein SYNPS1DRAFT_24991 [Syncephalis pseudoplumigaleata]|eukprot:RKP23045.1 hypothetical protein SYNPS1DRAFT_24991 [Syncephalis pseudoplumigaleata]